MPKVTKAEPRKEPHKVIDFQFIRQRTSHFQRLTTSGMYDRKDMEKYFGELQTFLDYLECDMMENINEKS